jgi:hypothetical protein
VASSGPWPHVPNWRLLKLDGHRDRRRPRGRPYLSWLLLGCGNASCEKCLRPDWAVAPAAVLGLHFATMIAYVEIARSLLELPVEAGWARRNGLERASAVM